MRRGRALTGSGHVFTESLNLVRDLDAVDLFASRAPALRADIAALAEDAAALAVRGGRLTRRRAADGTSQAANGCFTESRWRTTSAARGSPRTARAIDSLVAR